MVLKKSVNAKMDFETYAQGTEKIIRISQNILRRFYQYLRTWWIPIFALKPWIQAGHFEYHEPYNSKKFVFGLVICEDIDILSHPSGGLKEFPDNLSFPSEFVEGFIPLYLDTR